MKKFMKVMASALAMAMVLGMTVCAAPSTSTENSDITSDVLADDANKVQEGTTAKIGDTDVEVVVNSATVAVYDDAAKKASAVVSNAEVVKVVTVVDIDVPALKKGETAVVKITLPKVEAGKSYVLLHEVSAGNWEVINPTEVGAGYLVAELKGFSNYAVVEVQPVAEDEDDDDDDEEVAAPVDAAVSPKTGEALPVAGGIALVCLAGVVFCAKKAKFN